MGNRKGEVGTVPSNHNFQREERRTFSTFVEDVTNGTRGSGGTPGGTA
jgi:hypothetical protein